ncbi:hypothetical protein F5884DRAFT_857573 [Xylogone sp. PMI_703]|nr:hypothetical protein F5884DRAFT_857573 [Xylogone sp. PMI_703]
MASWIPVKEDSDFSLRNLPYGVFSANGSGPRIGTAIGEFALDLKVLAQDGVFNDLNFVTTTLQEPTLNPYAALGKDVHREVRKRLQQILEKDTKLGNILRDNQDRRNRSLIPLSTITMHLPMVIGDYTDFFIGLAHAQNSASIARPGKTLEEIVPSFFGLPIAYHGRASSVVVSGTPFHRPKGQYVIDGKPQSGPCQKLDFEVEFACLIGQSNKMGDAIDVNNAEDHIFGVVLMNDWSARDIQFWESSLLGPFNGKNFCTTISPWVVPLDALEPFRTAPKLPDRELLPYLVQEKKESVYDIPVKVTLEANSEKYYVSTANTNNVIFSLAQMIAHHTRGGCPLRTGDLIATGTVSSEPLRERGCFLEMTQHGTVPYEIEAISSSKNANRYYLEDGDIVEFTAQLKGPDGQGNVGFGACTGQVLAAN